MYERLVCFRRTHPSKQLGHVQLFDDDSYQIVVALEGTRQATPGLSSWIEYRKWTSAGRESTPLPGAGVSVPEFSRLRRAGPPGWIAQADRYDLS